MNNKRYDQTVKITFSMSLSYLTLLLQTIFSVCVNNYSNNFSTRIGNGPFENKMRVSYTD